MGGWGNNYLRGKWKLISCVYLNTKTPRNDMDLFLHLPSKDRKRLKSRVYVPAGLIQLLQ